MAATTTQRRRRARFESVLRLAAPALDALLWVGERISYAVAPEDPGYDPPRPPRPDSIVSRRRG